MLSIIIPEEADLRPRYNIAPTTRCPIIYWNDEGNVGALARLGLIPHTCDMSRVSVLTARRRIDRRLLADIGPESGLQLG